MSIEQHIRIAAIGKSRSEVKRPGLKLTLRGLMVERAAGIEAAMQRAAKLAAGRR